MSTAAGSSLLQRENQCSSIKFSEVYIYSVCISLVFGVCPEKIGVEFTYLHYRAGSRQVVIFFFQFGASGK